MPNDLPTDDHLTLGQASSRLPRLNGVRVSTNAIWRWCRKGVMARSGERVRLEHVRLGGRILLKAEWVTAFSRRLAEADTAYFDARAEAAANLPPRDPRYDPPTRRAARARREAEEEACGRSTWQRSTPNWTLWGISGRRDAPNP